MSHSIEYSEDGERARITLDLNDASLDSDVDEGARQFGSLKNVLGYLPGPVIKRGAIVNAGSNDSDINNTSGALGFYDGPSRNSARYRPYFGFSWAASYGDIDWYRQVSSSSREELIPGVIGGSTNLYAVPTSKLPTHAGYLVVAGTNPYGNLNGVASPLLYPAMINFVGGGSTPARTIAGTGTFTASSETVTVSTLTAQQIIDSVGGMLWNDGDSAATQAGYLVVDANLTNTSITLDRVFAGSNTGAAKAFTIYAKATPIIDSTTAFGTSQRPHGAVAASAWGRLVIGNVAVVGASSVGTYPNRLRWCGLSSEGTAPRVGIIAWSATAYLDLPVSSGAILAIAPTRGSVVVFQESGMTNLLGAPTYDGIGSLDASDAYPGVAINGGFAFESTPTGVYFFDKNVGPCRFDGSRVERLGDKRVTRTMMPYGIKHVGYYDGKVVFSGETLPGMFVYDTGSDSWAQFSCAKPITNLIAGRTENDEDLVGLYNGRRVVNLTNCFDNPGIAATDFDGEPVLLSLRTGRIGDPFQRLTPTAVNITYRLQDLTTTNPEFRVTVWTGLPNSQAVAQTYTTGATALPESNTTTETWGSANWGEGLWGDAGELESKTVRLEALTIARGHTIQVEVQQIRGAGRADLFAVSVDCDVEGEASS